LPAFLRLLALALLLATIPAAQAGDPPGTVIIETIRARDTAVQSAKLSDEFEGTGFIATYELVCDKKRDEHEIRVANKGFYFRIDQGRVLKIRGASSLDDRLKKDWFCGSRAPSNTVKLVFDGDRLQATINGETFAPVWVRTKNPYGKRSQFEIKISGDGTRIENLKVVPWDVTKFTPLTIDRISPAEAKATALRMARDWPEARWIMSFTMMATDRKPNLQIANKDLKFGFTFDQKGRLTIDGAEKARIDLGESWSLDAGEKNKVTVRFDGEQLHFVVNGRKFKPIAARDGVSDAPQMPWWFSLADAMLEDFDMRRYVPDGDGDGIVDSKDACPEDPEDKDTFEDEDGCPDPDNDEDGILDADDTCPLKPETKNGVEDDDGCPDEVGDKDGDGIVDTKDGCPAAPEDKDGFEDEDGCPDLDNDADGIVDSSDKCPDEPETRNDFEDADGCPDEITDTDKDGILDAADKCVTVPEDRDGYEDEDGCPDPDNDGDGILDVNDKCPIVPETVNNFEDSDGCPDADADSDADGISDGDDKCVKVPEDRDGFEDEDGCPDPDNDGDGVLDAADKCPMAPETFNAFEDEDGCPDKGLAELQEVEVDGKKVKKITIHERVFFDAGKDSIKPASYAVLDAVYAVLKNTPDITAIRIEGHTDGDGSESANLDLSQRRTAAVKSYLIARGIDPGRMIPVGFGEAQPIDTNESKAGKANNRRVEFVVLD